jgi:hypothetical protein
MNAEKTFWKLPVTLNMIVEGGMGDGAQAAPANFTATLKGEAQKYSASFKRLATPQNT